jgi:hypothetical protein
MAGFFGLVDVDASLSAYTIDGTAGALVEQTYYVYHPTAGYSLLATLAAKLTATSGTKTFTCTINSTTGKVTIAGSATFSHLRR